jgi:pimeloyl-ACP methyl ester carboxylesterase
MDTTCNGLQKQVIASFGLASLGLVAEVPQKPLVVFVGGAMDSWNENLKSVFESYSDDAQEKRYFGWPHINTAATLIALWQRETAKPVCIVGHSLGGAAALYCSHRLSGRFWPRASVSLLVTLDGVGPLSALGPWQSSPLALPRSVFKKPENLAYWSNVWVDVSVPGCGNEIANFGGHWGHRDGADQNFRAATSHCTASKMFEIVEELVRSVS